MTRVLLVGKFKDISEDVYSNIIFSEYVFIKDSKLNPSANQFSLINHSCDNFVTFTSRILCLETIYDFK